MILGASGFIGTNLKEQLEYDLLTPTHQELELTNYKDVSDYLCKKRPDVILHCASKDDKYCFMDNISSFMSVALWNNFYGKMIYFGSGADFGRDRWEENMSENFLAGKPNDPYGASKWAITHYINEKVNNIVNLRLFGVYGKYEDYKRRFISHCLWAKYNNKKVSVNNARFDYIHIDDLIGIVRWFIENECKEKTYNVCRGQAVSLQSIAEMILPKEKITLKENKPFTYSGNNKKLLREMGWYYFTPLHWGIDSLDGWFKSQTHKK